MKRICPGSHIKYIVNVHKSHNVKSLHSCGGTLLVVQGCMQPIGHGMDMADLDKADLDKVMLAGEFFGVEVHKS